MHFAYADPPYPGQSSLYKNEETYDGEVDHERLVQRLVTEYPDGWALSTNSPSLRYVLSVCPEDVRIMAWVKPFAVFKPHVNPAYAWEPVIVSGGRPRGREVITIRDWCNVSVTLKKGLVGAKPEAFCHWLLGVLNVQPGDTVSDLYPGTGIMGMCVAQRLGRLNLARAPERVAQTSFPGTP